MYSIAECVLTTVVDVVVESSLAYVVMPTVVGVDVDVAVGDVVLKLSRGNEFHRECSSLIV